MAGQNLLGKLSDFMDKENVIRASAIVSDSDWSDIFPNAASIYTYDNFLQAMAKFPKFCGEAKNATDEASLQNACKIELATLLAHMKYTNPGLQKVRDGCAEAGGAVCKYQNYSPIYDYKADQSYYGRGALLVPDSRFYGALGSIAFDGAANDHEVLLENPDLVATNGRLAFLSAFKFYMQPTSHSIPTMHDSILGFYEPSTQGEGSGLCTGCFGTTINIINGFEECRYWVNSPDAATRASYYTEFCDQFGAECPMGNDQELKCKDMDRFNYNGTGASFSHYITPHWTRNKCYFVNWDTGYSVYNTNDYKRCVCEKWDSRNSRCLDIDQGEATPDEITDPDGDGDQD